MRSACAICGGTHPLGEYNRLREATPMAYAMTGVSDVAGAYRFYPAYTMVVFARDRRLFLQEEGSDEACELVTEDGRRFRCAEETDEIEFVRDASGRVTHLVGNGVEPAPKIR